MYYNSSNLKKQKPTTSYLVRSKLGPARSIFSTKPMSSYNQEKKKKLKKVPGTKMEFRKKPDYADTAYREAVSRLRILLAESYTPIKRPLRELDSAGEDTDNQSLISANSKTSKLLPRPYYHYLTMLPRRYYYPSSRSALNVLPTDGEKNILNNSKFDNNYVPPELMSFIEKQEDYIGQLEKESRFCRDELSSLLSKVKDVISENENLHEKQKSNLMASVFSHLETETETETEIEKVSLSPKKSKSRILEGPAIVFESRISELEAQLTQAKIDLKKALEENDVFKKKMSDGTILEGIGFDNYKKQLDNLKRENDTLQDTVLKLQNALSKIRDKENDTCDQVKRSLDVAEKAQYEKNAAEIEIRRLKDELERQHAKLREAISDQTRRISEERNAVERRYTQQIEQLTTELGVQWETTNKLQLELDKQRRENTDLRRELAQKQALLDDSRKDMQNKIMNLQSDIGVNGAEKSALEQQIATLQMSNERHERISKQEVARLQAEIQSLRQRLDRADADLIHSRRENIRLNEQVASLEKEIKLNTALNEERNKSSRNEVLALPPPKENKELSSLIQDIESKHAATVAELEGMIHSQNQLMDKLSNECHSLTKKLEDASARHKFERTKLRTKNYELMIRLAQIWNCLKSLNEPEMIMISNRDEIRELQTNLNHLNSRFSQSQIIRPNLKDEDYNSVSNNGRAPQQEKMDTPIEAVHKSKILSRAGSRTSVDATLNMSRRSSQERARSTQPVPSQIADVNNVTQPFSNYASNEYQYPAGNESEQKYGDQYDQQYVDETGQPVYDTQEKYSTSGQEYVGDQQYADPNAQYNIDQQYAQYGDPNLYGSESHQQYAADPNQQFGTNLEQLSDDPNQQYNLNLDQQYNLNPSQQYSENLDPPQEDPTQKESTETQ